MFASEHVTQKNLAKDKISPVQDRLQRMLRSQEVEQMCRGRGTFVVGTYSNYDQDYHGVAIRFNSQSLEDA